MATKNINALNNSQVMGWADCPIGRVAAGHVSIGGSLSLNGGTITADKPLINGTQTWNNAAVAFCADRINVTDTASNASSLLLDRQVGGVSKFSVSKSGVLSFYPYLRFVPTNDTNLDLYVGNSLSYRFGVARFSIRGEFGLATTYANNPEVFFISEGANVLAQRFGTNPQTFNLYNTYTSSSVYERGFMRWASNTLEIGTEHSGGSGRQTRITGGDTAPGTIRLSTALVMVGPELALSSAYGAGMVSANVLLYAPSDGILRLTNGSSNGFNLLRFGGDSAAYPAIKRSLAILQSRLADDSGFAGVQGKLQSHADAAAETPTATHTITIYDATGTAYKVLCVAA